MDDAKLERIDAVTTRLSAALEAEPTMVSDAIPALLTCIAMIILNYSKAHTPTQNRQLFALVLDKMLTAFLATLRLARASKTLDAEGPHGELCFCDLLDEDAPQPFHAAGGKKEWRH